MTGTSSGTADDAHGHKPHVVHGHKPHVMREARAPPHVLLLLADDYGWANAGWHAGSAEVATPHLNALVKAGIELERHYAHKYCSPSRSALQSGRSPAHVNVNNHIPLMHNPADRVSGYSAIPRNMTGLAELMKRAGYATAMAGKWDAGQATAEHTPKGRGYDRSLFYFNHDNDYWTSLGGAACPGASIGHTWHAYTKPANWSTSRTFVARNGYLAAGGDLAPPHHASALPEALAFCSTNASCGGFTFQDYDARPPPSRPLRVSFKTAEGAKHFVPDRGVPPRDLWMDDGPAPPAYRSPQPLCSGVPYPAGANASERCVYEDDVFARFLLERVDAWSAADGPLFLFWAFHAVHSPYQVPKADYERFGFVPYAPRRVYAAMVAHMDGLVGRMVALLETKRMLERTLVIFSADNGGPITQAANNWPLRGGKHSNWDGGVRVNAFVSGGLVPPEKRGSRSSSLVAIWDWYATLATLAGLGADQLVDRRAAAAGLPPVDSIDQSAHLLGRAELATEPAATPTLAPAPRTELPLGSCANAHREVFCAGSDPGVATVGGLVVAWTSPASSVLSLAKLLVGWVPLDCQTGPSYPNGTSTVVMEPEPTHEEIGAACPWKDCGAGGCLYNLTHDETEADDLLAPGSPPPGPELAQLLAHMRARLVAHNASAFSPDRGQLDVAGACAAARANGGVWGPWLS